MRVAVVTYGLGQAFGQQRVGKTFCQLYLCVQFELACLVSETVKNKNAFFVLEILKRSSATSRLCTIDNAKHNDE